METGIPTIKSYLKDSKFQFNISHTTAEFTANANVVIDVNSNILRFSNYTDGLAPTIDEYTVRQIFEDYGPHIELYCPSMKCGLMYYLSGDWLKISKIPDNPGAWAIAPFHLLLEGAKVRNYIIHNYWNTQTTRIYSVKHEESRPIEIPMIDFSTMDKERLINRVLTLVTFS